MHLSKAKIKTQTSAFTIVELLIVIVIIGILAAITIVSYTGISQRANIATLQSDLANAKKKLEMYYVEHNVYLTSLDSNGCATNTTQTPNTDTNYCIKPSAGVTLTLNTGINASNYSLRASNGTKVYAINNVSSTPQETVIIDSNWITIGSQTWAKANLNVGTRIAGTSTQTNNGTIEKYCYGNTDAGCTNTDANGIAYGALYQWDEAMNYSTTEGAQGICPTGSHIPTDAEWKTLEMYLGMTQAQADLSNAWRGTTEGTQLKSGGTSGLNVPLAGFRNTDGSFTALSFGTYLWSSSGSSASVWVRHLHTSNAAVYRYLGVKVFGFSVRCLGN